MARTALNQTEANCKSVGIDPAAFPNDRGRWLLVSALAELEKAETLFENELASLDGIEEPNLFFQGIVNAANFLATPPEPPRFDDAGYLPRGLLASGELASTMYIARGGRSKSRITTIR